MGWARVTPSRCLLASILLTTTVTVCACVASCAMLWMAPQVPFSSVYCGGYYIRGPALGLAATALLSSLSLFLGSCGTSRDSRAALLAYCVVLVMVAGGEVIGSGTVFTFAYIGKLESVIGGKLRSDVGAYMNGSTVEDRVNDLQRKYKCCGVVDYMDWNGTDWKKKEAGPGQLAPETCCQDKLLSNCSYNSAMLYHTGCVDVLMNRTDIAIDCVLALCVLAALLNLGTMLLTCRAIKIITRYRNYTVI